MKHKAPTIRPSEMIERIELYAPPKHGAPCDLQLQKNEGAPPPKPLLEALQATSCEEISRYPDARPLEALLARRIGMDPENIIVTAGGDDAIARALRAVMGEGRDIIVHRPTFEMIGTYAKLAGGSVVEIDWRSGPYPLDAVLSSINERTAAIAVVTPNNPTGLVVTLEEIQKLSKAAPSALILVDLAYIEFADRDISQEVLQLPNALIVRTFSKAWGLAGLRVGWAAGPRYLIDWMRACGNPYAVSSASLSLVQARLALDGGIERETTRVREEIREIMPLIRELGGEALPSQANFVLARFPRADWVHDGLAGLGIAVRSFPNDTDLQTFLRITMPGDAYAFARLTDALRAVCQPQALLFDIDDTLADVSRSYQQAILQTAAHFGATLSEEAIFTAKAKGDANNDWLLTQRLLHDVGIEIPLEEVTAHFEELYQGSEGKLGLKHEEQLLLTPEKIEKLAQRFRLGIVTGRPLRDAMEFLEREGIAGHFGAIITMEDGPLKPHPAPVRRALQKLGVTSAWMIGDTPDDMRAAREAQVVPIGIVAPALEPVQTRSILTQAGASRVIETLPELLEMLP